MTETSTAPEPPGTGEVIDAIRAGLGRVLAPEDLAQVPLGDLDAHTPMLSLPVDSAALMALMTELEDSFSVFIDEEAAFGFTELGDVADYIGSRITERNRRLSAQ